LYWPAAPLVGRVSGYPHSNASLRDSGVNHLRGGSLVSTRLRSASRRSCMATRNPMPGVRSLGLIRFRRQCDYAACLSDVPPENWTESDFRTSLG
jgi:hypothetical protein